MPTKYALLVGIDHYPTGSRHHKDGSLVRLKGLNGCVNDVVLMSELLGEFGFRTPVFLVSSSLQSTGIAVENPVETTYRPTFSNIKREFHKIVQESEEGDTFFFHYSGHGAQLDPIKRSPDNESLDASLLPMDYCCGGKPIRGWHLNKWLSHLCNVKKVHVVVSLDSCFAAGAWRHNGTPRSPEGWIPPPNLPSDEVDQEDLLLGLLDGRNSSIGSSWEDNPEYFTLMAASQEDQAALERAQGGKTYGVFTYQLHRYLVGHDQKTLPTYRTIRDRIEGYITPQVPKIFGRDRLVFLETKETFLAAPIQVTICSGTESALPVGKIHGVTEGMVFVSRKASSPVIIKVRTVRDYDSDGTLESGATSGRWELLPFKWHFEKPIEFLVEASLGADFLRGLRVGLEDRITSTIVVRERAGIVETADTDTVRFFITKSADQRIDIIGPDLLGYAGPVHGLSIADANSSAAPTESAVTLSHLSRYAQLYGLGKKASSNIPEFSVAIDKPSSPTNPLFVGQEVTYTFTNRDSADLYFTGLNLGPGLHVLQRYPVLDTAQRVLPGREVSFKMKLSLPAKLRHPDVDCDKYAYRDIFRTVVTRGRSVSLKSMELPDIWDAAFLRCGQRDRRERDAEVCAEFDWWIEDVEMYTRRCR
ncbi:hypothetical protein LZ32DRAFT_693838 [Colletotrichum eremochloae]|nr:hypothetical protein LZ32DRAFT_693838 [Colletotrichum eremochloae]